MSHRISKREGIEAEYRRANESLRYSEKKLALHFEQTLLGVIEWDVELRVNEWNPAAETIFGYSREEALGRSARELILRKDILGEIDALWNKLLELTGGEYNRNENITKDGRKILCEWFNTPLVDNNGNLIGVMSLVQDITERKRLEEALKASESIYRAIFETTGAATLIIEEDTIISLVNSEFEKITGYVRDEVEGKISWTALIPHEDEQHKILAYHRSRRINADAAPRRYETFIADRQGKRRDILVNIDMIPGTNRSVATFMDITERKRDEITLRERKEELKSKTRALEEMNAALRVLLKQRETDKTELEDRILASVKELVMPHVKELKKCLSGCNELTHVHILESNLQGILSPFAQKISLQFLNLTPKEIQVANLIKEGKTTKEIARFMNLSRFAIDAHRAQLRSKLGLTRKKANLRTYLLAMSK
jgi:PAS domain S-box-containing protein